MSRISVLVLIFGAAAVLIAATEQPDKNILLPASAVVPDNRNPTAASEEISDSASNESFEQRVSQTQADIRAVRGRRFTEEIKLLSNDLDKITDDVLHMASDFQKLENLEWKMSILSRKIETALARTKKISLSAPKDPVVAAPAEDLLAKARDLVGECRRLGIQEPLIRNRIGLSQDALNFTTELDAAKQYASQIEKETQSLLSRIQ